MKEKNIEQSLKNELTLLDQNEGFLKADNKNKK